MLWLSNIQNLGNPHSASSSIVRINVSLSPPLKQDTLIWSTKDAENSDFFYFSVTGKSSGKSKQPVNRVYYIDGENKNVFYIGDFDQKNFNSQDPVFIGRADTLIPLIDRAQQVRSSFDVLTTQGKECSDLNTGGRRWNRGLITAFLDESRLHPQVFGLIDPLECWVFKKYLSEAINLMQGKKAAANPQPVM